MKGPGGSSEPDPRPSHGAVTDGLALGERLSGSSSLASAAPELAELLERWVGPFRDDLKYGRIVGTDLARESLALLSRIRGES